MCIRPNSTDGNFGIFSPPNRRLTGIETIVLFAEPGLDSISSTVVRELTHFGHDCGEFLPCGAEF